MTENEGEGTLATVVGALKWAGRSFVASLQTDDEHDGMRLAIPEAQTTTVDGDIGWEKRPPAGVTCPNCGSEIHHANAADTIDCPRCTGEFPPEEFPKFELLYFQCPVCRDRMEYGSRHPNAVDAPEWATCHNCRYHWEFIHF